MRFSEKLMNEQLQNKKTTANTLQAIWDLT